MDHAGMNTALAHELENLLECANALECAIDQFNGFLELYEWVDEDRAKRCRGIAQPFSLRLLAWGERLNGALVEIESEPVAQ